MKTRTYILVVAVLGVALLAGTVVAQSQPANCEGVKSRTPSQLEGQVVRIDMDNGKVIVRTIDGTTHEFQADKETLKDYKVGDRIHARLRPGTSNTC